MVQEKGMEMDIIVVYGENMDAKAIAREKPARVRMSKKECGNCRFISRRHATPRMKDRPESDNETRDSNNLIPCVAFARRTPSDSHRIHTAYLG
jgi:hypothetical protein